MVAEKVPLDQKAKVKAATRAVRTGPEGVQARLKKAVAVETDLTRLKIAKVENKQKNKSYDHCGN